jgi:hypothetical protein
MPGRYNATVFQTWNDLEGHATFLADVNEEGKMLRSNWIQFTQYDGTPVYDEYIRARHPESIFTIVRDGGQGYKDRLLGLALPPDYLAAIQTGKANAGSVAEGETHV